MADDSISQKGTKTRTRTATHGSLLVSGERCPVNRGLEINSHLCDSVPRSPRGRLKGTMVQKRKKAKKLVLPGHSRVVVQVYHPDRRMYAQPAGFSLSRVEIGSQAELERLWQAIRDTVNVGTWRDAAQRMPVQAAS